MAGKRLLYALPIAAMFAGCPAAEEPALDGANPRTDAAAPVDAAADAGDPEGGRAIAPRDGPGMDVAIDTAAAKVSTPATPPCTGDACPSGIAPGHLQLWLRGDRGLDCAGGMVERWRDLSGHERDALPPAGKAGPLCGAQMLNGHATVFFPHTNGRADAEHLEVDLTPLAGSPFSIAVVEKRTGLRQDGYLVGSQLPFPDDVSCGLSVNRERGLVLGYNASSFLWASTWGEDCDLAVSVPPSAPKPSIVMMTYQPQVGLSLFRDGTKLGTSPSRGLRSIVKGFIGRGYQLGQYPEDTRYSGQIAEIVVFDSALSDVERGALEAYFKATWDSGP
jgi:hypothetical protein